MFPSQLSCQLFAFAYGWKISRHASFLRHAPLDCCHGTRLVSFRFSFFTFRFTLFIFPFHPPSPGPVSCQLTIGASAYTISPEIKAEATQPTAARHFNGAFGRIRCRHCSPNYYAPAAASWRHLNVHICGCRAAAALLLPLVLCVAQVFAPTEHKTKTRLESVSKLHREHTEATAAAVCREPTLKQEWAGSVEREGLWGEGEQSFVMKAATLLRAFHVFSYTIYVHIRNLGTSMWFSRVSQGYTG